MKKEVKTLEQMKKEMVQMDTKIQIAQMVEKTLTRVSADFFESKYDEDGNVLRDEDYQTVKDYTKPVEPWFISSDQTADEVASLALQLQARLLDTLMDWVQG